MNIFNNFGNTVDGYDVKVLNEREARAGAGLLFVFGFLSFVNSFMLGHFEFAQYFVGFFMIDFAIRLINPNYSPSLLLGRFFVKNQIPEYVGASQKRFAWSIGLILSIVMFYLLVLNPQITPIKILICGLCLILLLAESAFSICLGCKIYNLFNKEKATNCPGGICEIRVKDDIQKFNILQKLITIGLVGIILFGLYSFSMKTENRSSAMLMMPMMMSTNDNYAGKCDMKGCDNPNCSGKEMMNK